MGVASFAFTYPWTTIESDLPVTSAGSTPSIHTGEDAGTTLDSGGGLVEAAPISDVWQQTVDSVTSKLAVRDRDLEDYLGAWLQVSQMTGKLSGTGTAAAAHGVVGAPARVISVSAWYIAGDGSAAPLIVANVTSSLVNLAGGVPGAAFRAVMIFGTGL